MQGYTRAPAHYLPLPSGLQVQGGAVIRRLSVGREEVEIKMKTEMRNNSAGVKFPPESLLCILTTPKETLQDSCRPNSASIEDLGSNTLETGYGARRNTLAKCHLKIHSSISSRMPTAMSDPPSLLLSLSTFLLPSFLSSFLLSFYPSFPPSLAPSSLWDPCCFLTSR